ncbi:hypothetical protein ABID94_003467 [Streptomyces sp. PvR018]
MRAGDPVISVDTKKKELVGQYKNGGREWHPKGLPTQVRTHDFLDRQGPGKAIPYGIYDVAANTRWVSVDTDHDTAAFAVASIRPPSVFRRHAECEFQAAGGVLPGLRPCWCSALMRWASSSWSSRITMRQAASIGVPPSTSSRARAAMRSW